jgi:hypothetical protein
MMEFVDGRAYLVWWAGFIAVYLIRELIKWLVETRRTHIAIWFSAVLLVLSVALPFASKASGGAWDPGLKVGFETILFGFTMWFIYGGIDRSEDPGVSRRRFFHRRVDSLEGLSSEMAERAAKREKARRRRQGVHRKPFFWNAFKRVFGRKENDPFNW